MWWLRSIWIEMKVIIFSRYSLRGIMETISGASYAAEMHMQSPKYETHILITKLGHATTVTSF
jgi:hypothetical protein